MSLMRPGADNGSRTHTFGLECRCSAVELHPHKNHTFALAILQSNGDSASKAAMICAAVAYSIPACCKDKASDRAASAKTPALTLVSSNS